MTNDNLILLNEIKDTGQDYEWYATTNEIIEKFYAHVNEFEIGSLLDIGAGNGKVLTQFEALKEAAIAGEDDRRHSYGTSLFAIEKSLPLLNSLPSNISMMGADFWEQSLLDKNVDCIFSNPPYSDFINWSVKIISEANASFIYLVMPERWKNQAEIKAAIEKRKASFEVVGQFDFLNAEDRKARAKVDLVYINLCSKGYSKTFQRRSDNAHLETDPFELWIEQVYKFKMKFQASVEKETLNSFDTQFKKKSEEEKHALIAGSGLIDYLYQFYTRDMEKLTSNYMALSELDPVLLHEMKIDVAALCENIKSRVKGLKNKYWNELFAEYEVITKRFTESTREKFLGIINSKTNVDFNPSNAYGITAWAIRNANHYLDEQLVDVFSKLVSLANVENYKSNQRVYSANRWGYMDEKMTHIKLNFRIVLENGGGLEIGWNNMNGLAKRGAGLLNDLLVIADNLGFERYDDVKNHQFDDSSAHEFVCKSRKGSFEPMTLFTVRAYLNGNLHIKLNKEFALALNVEAGRLQGWIHNSQQGASELGEDPNKVNQYFKQSFKVLPNALNTVLLPNAKAA